MRKSKMIAKIVQIVKVAGAVKPFEHPFETKTISNCQKTLSFDFRERERERERESRRPERAIMPARVYYYGILLWHIL